MKYKRAKLLSVLLAGTVMCTSTVGTYGAYNGSSGAGSGSTSSSGSGNNGKPLISGFDIKNQFFSYRLYFMPMEAELLGRESEKVEARNKKWTDDAGKAIAVGSEVLVSRDGFKKAGTDKKTSATKTYSGDIFSAFGQGQSYIGGTFEQLNIPFVNAKDIGLTEGDKYPVYMTSVAGETVQQGYSTLDYFMKKNDNYIEGETAEYLTKDNMKNLLRYMAGVDKSTGLATLSFKDDADTLTLNGVEYKRNVNSVFDEGTYKGQLGEYRLFIEAGVIANGIAYTARELVTADIANGGKDALVYNLANNFLGNMTNHVYLTEDDGFNLKKAVRRDYRSSSDFKKFFNQANWNNYIIDAVNGNIGNAVNVLSSELFRTPTQRTIGTHTNIFLDTGDSVSMEYVGNGTEISLESSEQFREIIAESKLDDWYIDNVNKLGLGGLGAGYALDFVRGYIQDGFVRDSYNKSTQTNAGTYLTYASMLQLKGVDKITDKTNTVIGMTLKTLEKDRAQGVQLVNDSDHNKLKGTDVGTGHLNEVGEQILRKNSYINPDNDYVDTLRSYDAKGLKFVPVAAGGTVMKVYQEGNTNISTALLPKGILKDIIDDTMDVVGGKLVDEYVGNTSRSASGTVGDIVSEVLGSNVNSVGRSSVVYNQDNSLVTTTVLDNASYGKAVGGKVEDRSINTYKLNTIIESTLSLSGVYGSNIIAPDVYTDAAWATKEKPISSWVFGSTRIEPYRFYGGETNDEIKSKTIGEIDKAKDAEVSHIESAGVDKYYTSASIATRNDKDVSKQSEYIQTVSEVALNSVLPKTLSEINEASHYKLDILGNYGSSYIVWDVGIPIDIIVMAKDSNGKLKVIDGVQDGKDGYAILTDQWYVPSGTERILGIPNKIKLKLETGEMNIVPKEAVMKPASVSLEEFIQVYESEVGKNGAVLDFGNDLMSIVRQDPFEYKTNDASRATATMSANSMAGGVTHYINNGKGNVFTGAMGIVASESDKEAYISNPNENRMALVLTVDVNDSSSVTQYNVVETKRNGNLISTEVIKTKPKYDSNGDVILDSTIDDAKQQEWVTSDKDEPPTKWDDVETKVPASSSSDKPSEKIPTIDKDGDGEKDKENIYVRYEKDTRNTKLRLTEKRITWQKSLLDLGGLPEVTFRWDAADGEHIHTVYTGMDSDGNRTYSEEVCTEYLVDDFFRFIATNTNTVDGTIIGNVSPFIPKDDKSSVAEVTRGSDAGSYTLKPNYWYVLYRGDDKPTVAAYRYDDANEVRTNADEILKLLGAGQEGIENVTPRHKSNHSNYLRNTTFNITKANYSTGTMGALNGVYGTTNANDAGSKYDGDVASWESYKMHEHTEKKLYDDAKSSYNSALNRYNYLSESSSASMDELANARNELKYAEEDLANATERYNTFMGELKASEDKLNNVSDAVDGIIGDYNYSTQWTHSHHPGIFFGHATGIGEVIDVNVQVDVEYGSPNDVSKQQRNNATSSTFKTADGTVWNNAKGNNLHNSVPFEFTPYVEMYYDTTNGQGKGNQNKSVSVLGGHKSTMLTNDYIEIGYNTYGNGDHKTGLLLTSEQWSTHSKAASLGKTETVLPGGAIYKLATPNGKDGLNRTKVAVSSWQTVLPDDVASGIINQEAKDYYSLKAVQDRNNLFFTKLVKSLNSLDIVQYVNGKEVLQSDKSSNTPSGQPLSQDKKYWLQQGQKDGTDGTFDSASAITSTKPNEADLDVTDRVADKVTYYRVYADTNGNVTVKKGNTIPDTAPSGKGTAIAMIKKNGSIDKLLANAEVAELDNKTKLVSNFINTLDRNTGNDVSLADDKLVDNAAIKDGKWYNEAWDGFVVMKTERVIEVGFKDTNKDTAIRSAALDPKLTPKKENQYDLYTKKVGSYFGTRAHTNLDDRPGYVGTISGKYENGNKNSVDIFMGDMQGIYRSKDFVIPNATVMDLH